MTTVNTSNVVCLNEYRRNRIARTNYSVNKSIGCTDAVCLLMATTVIVAATVYALVTFTTSLLVH